VHLLLVLLSTLSLSQPAGPVRPGPSRDLLTASHVLHGWDARREAAWASSDPVALGSLYVRGSVAARRDVRLLREYDERGLVVRRIVTQVLALHVLHADSRHLRLRVVDRVAGGDVSGRPLGTTRAKERVIELRRTGATWRVVSVTARGPRR
jgi:hypothetical protein